MKVAFGILAALFISLCNAQVALPPSRLGEYLLGSGKSPVQIELFVDLFCSDAQAEYQMWKTLAAQGEVDGSKVGVKFQIIVEPFHPWSFTAAGS